MIDKLRKLELTFSGGGRSKAYWPKASPLDPRPREEIDRGGPDGHRMQPRSHKGRDYAPAYAKELRGRSPKVLVELGVLRGIGLAIWCELFPNARIIGLDIDVDNFKSNVETLRSRGAFCKNFPEVHQFDELAAMPLDEILQGDRIDVAIDDAIHIEGPILGAMSAIMPHMSDDFLYFIEDHSSVHKVIRKTYPRLRVVSYRELTVIKP